MAEKGGTVDRRLDYGKAEAKAKSTRDIGSKENIPVLRTSGYRLEQVMHCVVVL